MKRSILQLEVYDSRENYSNNFRSIIKTKHGRVIFLSLRIEKGHCSIENCFYADRNQGRTGLDRYRSKPLMLQTFQFPVDKLLSVIEMELDKKYFGLQYIENETANLTLEAYLKFKLESPNRKYDFLIMVGDGDIYNGLPVRLRTRLKNKLHRAVYLELAYYKDGKGVVMECYYYDRKYLRQNNKITPPMLISCFFPFSKQGIIDLLNHEIICDFTHMIVVNEGIDLDSNTTPLCGAV